MEKEDIKRYAVLVVGITLSLGFAFGAVQSFSGMVDAPAAGERGQQTDAELPQERMTDTAFDLGPEEMYYLAVTENVVFVSLYYGDEEQRQQAESIRNELDDNFGETVYVAVVDEGENDILMTQFEVNEMPGYLIIGDNEAEPFRAADGGLNNQQVASDVCGVMSTWGDYASYCNSL